MEEGRCLADDAMRDGYVVMRVRLSVLCFLLSAFCFLLSALCSLLSALCSLLSPPSSILSLLSFSFRTLQACLEWTKSQCVGVLAAMRVWSGVGVVISQIMIVLPRLHHYFYLYLYLFLFLFLPRLPRLFQDFPHHSPLTKTSAATPPELALALDIGAGHWHWQGGGESGRSGGISRQVIGRLEGVMD